MSHSRLGQLLLSVWPGLSRLWRGKVSGLILALAFSWLFCVAILLTGYWPEWVRPGLRTMVWLLVAGVWAVTAGLPLIRLVASGGAAGEVDSLGLFCHAQVEYLKGNLQQAERLLLRLLMVDPDDCDARLMLATLYRHCGHVERSRQQLDHLIRAPGGEKWQVEVARELELLRRSMKPPHETAN